MYLYAELNEENIVIGISQLTGEITYNHFIDITNFEEIPTLGSAYVSSSNTFLPSTIEESERKPTLEEIAETTLIETQYQTVLIEMIAGF